MLNVAVIDRVWREVRLVVEGSRRHVAERVKCGSVFGLMFLVKWKAQKWKLVESKLVKWSSFGSDLNPHRQQHLMIVEFIYLIL